MHTTTTSQYVPNMTYYRTYLTHDEVLSHLPYFCIPFLHRVEQAMKRVIVLNPYSNDHMMIQSVPCFLYSRYSKASEFSVHRFEVRSVKMVYLC